jgi:hypothetical protein
MDWERTTRGLVSSCDAGEVVQQLSRRKFLLGASAAVAGALLTPGGASGAVSRSGRAVAGSVPAPITGATVNPSAYHMSNWVKGANLFDSYVGYPLATTIQKIYMQQGQFYTDPLPVRITQLAAVGCQFIVCVYPSTTTDESSQLSDFLQLLNGKGIVYQAALVNEWNCKDKFATPQAYLNYWSQYAPVVQDAGVPLVNLVCASSNKAAFAKIEPGFPTDPLPDAYWIDFYATGYSYNVRLDLPGGLLDQAKSYGVPVGIGEFGWSATGGSPTMAQWDAYCSYLVRLAPRLPLGCLYWGCVGGDVVTSADDPKVPGIQQVVSAF